MSIIYKGIFVIKLVPHSQQTLGIMWFQKYIQIMYLYYKTLLCCIHTDCIKKNGTVRNKIF